MVIIMTIMVRAHPLELAFAIATALNVALVAIQATYGVVAHSMALLADAGHNAGDVLALLLAWGSHAISQSHPTERYTYGFRSSSIIAALINATILLVVTGAIAWAAILRLFEPQPVAGVTVMVVAAIAIRHQRRRRRDPRARQHQGPQCLWRVPASSVGRRGLRRCRRRWPGHPFDRLALGRPGGEPGHFRRHRLEYVGAVARRRENVAAWRAAADRSGRSAESICNRSPPSSKSTTCTYGR